MSKLLENLSILSRWGRPKALLSSFAELKVFLGEHAALISQKNLIGYCHVKTKLPLHELMRDKPFHDAFYVSRWEAFMAILADIVVVFDEFLAPEPALSAADRHAGLLAAFDAVVAENPPPNGAAVSDPAALRAALVARLAELVGRAPVGVARIAEVGGRRLFKTVPIHMNLAKPDRPAVVAGVKFMMVRSCGGMAEKFDGAALAANLAARAA